jgi:putative Mn2+ efflux pump MntP
MEAKQKQSVVGSLVCGCVFLLGGVTILLTGRAGYRAAYASGENIVLGGVIMAVIGAWLIASSIRRKKKEAIQPAETTRGK